MVWQLALVGRTRRSLRGVGDVTRHYSVDKLHLCDRLCYDKLVVKLIHARMLLSLYGADMSRKVEG